MIKVAFEDGASKKKRPLTINEATFLKLFEKYKNMSYDTKKFWVSSFKIWPFLIFIAVALLFFNGSLPVQIALIVYALSSIKIGLDIYTFEIGVFERWLNKEGYIVKYTKEYIEKHNNLYACQVRDWSL